MFPYPIATPQGCNIQTFTGIAGTTGSTNYSWNKPVGVSHVYIMLIGGGGTGDATNGGGSGAVTVWYGAAQHVPDSLVIIPSRSGQTSSVTYRSSSSTFTLLSASGGGTPTAATASAATAFAASGFYNSTAGQAGGNGSDPGASSTTFLGGGMRAQTTLTGNYGYATSGIGQGFFQMQPIIVGVGSGDNATGAGLAGAIGCGGGGNNGGTQFPGGPGMVLIASW